MKRPRFHVYEAKDGYRWRLLAANNRLIAESGEAYTRERDANRAVKAVKLAIARSMWPTTVVQTFNLHGQMDKTTTAQIARMARGH